MGIDFYIQSLLLGIGLAMDACCVSMANGLNNPKMSILKALIISFTFGAFQMGMPLIGYFVGHAFIQYIEPFIPWIALLLLGFLGGKMLIEGIKNDDEETKNESLTLKIILIQAVATSIDALSVGFTIADYSVIEAVVSTSFILLATFGICVGAVYVGKKFGTKLGNKANILGGLILIAIGINIFVQGIFF